MVCFANVKELEDRGRKHPVFIILHGGEDGCPCGWEAYPQPLPERRGVFVYTSHGHRQFLKGGNRARAEE
jgi:hypothetical protein